jgi:hypothetical protein
MTRIRSALAATLFTAATIAASTAPALAGGGISFGFGAGGYGPYYGGPYGGGGIYVDVGPDYVGGYKNTWKKHVKWCLAHYKTYNPNTNYYKTKWGPQECESPFM